LIAYDFDRWQLNSLVELAVARALHLEMWFACSRAHTSQVPKRKLAMANFRDFFGLWPGAPATLAGIYGPALN
jgi:hypothetical protein